MHGAVVRAFHLRQPTDFGTAPSSARGVPLLSALRTAPASVRPLERYPLDSPLGVPLARLDRRRRSCDEVYQRRGSKALLGVPAKREEIRGVAALRPYPDDFRTAILELSAASTHVEVAAEHYYFREAVATTLVVERSSGNYLRQ